MDPNTNPEQPAFQPSQPQPQPPISPAQPVVLKPESAPAPVPPTPYVPLDPTQPVVMSGAVPSTDVTAAPPAPALEQKPSKLRLSKAALAVIAAGVVLCGASAAAYFVTASNSPANVLKAALINTARAKQESFKGTIDIDPSKSDSESGLAAKMIIDGKADSAKKASQVAATITVSGVSLSVEARIVDGDIYVKAGDLSGIATLANAFSPELGSAISGVSGTVSNKWIMVDSTLLKQAGASCALDTNWSLTDKDVDLLTNQYAKHPFTTIKDTSSDSVGGKKATKFDLEIDNKKLGQYAKNLDGLSMIKALDSCSVGDELNKDTEDLPAGTTDLTLWVDKASKRISQVAYVTPSEEVAKSGSKASAKVAIDYSAVSISKPANATPLLEVLAQLQSSGSLDFFSQIEQGINDKAEGTFRQTNVRSIQTQLEIFYQDNGYYPSVADLSSLTWRQTNMKNIDENSFNDPDGNALKVTATPGGDVLLYQPKTAAGGSCEADHTLCASYNLSVTLPDGTVFSKQNLD